MAAGGGLKGWGFEVCHAEKDARRRASPHDCVPEYRGRPLCLPIRIAPAAALKKGRHRGLPLRVRQTGSLHQGAVRRGYFLAARPVPVAWLGRALGRTDGGTILDREKTIRGLT